jgi:hypothetical protein
MIAVSANISAYSSIDSTLSVAGNNIDWKQITFGSWSVRFLQKQWTSMKKSVDGHENMTHRGQSRLH